MKHDSKPSDPPAGVPDEGDPSSTEARRMAARRRFLGRSAAVGTGAIVYTIHHARSFAGGGTTTYYLSSPEHCMSLTGNWGTKVKTVDSINPTPIRDKYGKITGYQQDATRYQCTGSSGGNTGGDWWDWWKWW